MGDQQTNNPCHEITLQDPLYLMKTGDRKQLHTPTKLMHKLPSLCGHSHSLISSHFSFTTSCLLSAQLQTVLSLGIPVATTLPRCSRRRRQMAAESGRFPRRQENTNSGDLGSIRLSSAELLQRQPLNPWKRGSLTLQIIAVYMNVLESQSKKIDT